MAQNARPESAGAGARFVGAAFSCQARRFKNVGSMGLDFNARRDVLMVFATPLTQTRVREAAEINPGLRRTILDREAVAPAESRSNVGGWQSKADFLTWGGKEIAVIEESFREAAGRMMALIAHP